ncbi:hypothetical protein NLI96_g10468 [Meripilus lineatus]|uniref:Uncharacterized protein n=1 Tax=Meripilus lineatus TaxID=2056292 RepID=A0AAD5Y996_9APHY|nr:hypothetical protein NLI96_g10468 [Physisporinus lineatus]
MPPLLHYQVLDTPQPFGYQPPPTAKPMVYPARVAALSGGVGAGVPPPMGVGIGMGPGPQLGMVRSADEMVFCLRRGRRSQSCRGNSIIPNMIG